MGANNMDEGLPEYEPLNDVEDFETADVHIIVATTITKANAGSDIQT